jgi:geranylgeranyl reductase family protein
MKIEPILDLDCDVLIVGGGPAGSGLAIHLAKQNIDVTVLESQVFPRDKVCGDALSPLAIKELQTLGVGDHPTFEKANEIKVATIFVEDQEVGEIDLPPAKDVDAYSKVIPRKILDNLIYEKAKENGVRYLENHKFHSYKIEANYAQAIASENGEEKTFRCKLIVGADGANSAVARLLHGAKPSQSERLFALRAYYEGINGPSDLGQIHFNRSNFPGLYWVFPTSKSTANIGLGMIAETLPKNQTKIKELLNNHIRNSPNLKKRIGNGKMVGKIQGWPLSNYNPEKKIVSDRILLLGDAAGFINALSGDGVQYALQTANWASTTISECILKNDFSAHALGPFSDTIHKKLGLDFAFADIVVQAGRNKALELIALRLLKILLERSKKDRNYGSIIGGIFGGTYPSYNVMSPSFIIKTLTQLGMHIGENTGDLINNKNKGLLKVSSDALSSVAEALEIINQDPASHLKWAKILAKKGVTVGKNVLQNNR